MGNGFSEAALAVFTTLAPMGACAFIVLCAACFKGAFEGAAGKALDKAAFLPLAVVAVGFIGAFFHLANPLNAFFVFMGVGSSPLSNEVTVGVVFFVLAAVYCILAVAGKLSAGARKGLLAAASVVAVVFAVFCGLAYTMYTIPTWNTPASVVQMLGYGLLGGGVLGLLTLALADAEIARENAMAGAALSIAGLVIGVAGFAWQIMAAQSASNIWGVAADQVPAIWGLFGALAVCGIIGAAVAGTFRKKPVPAALAAAVVIVAVGIFFARIGFYGLYMSVAL